MMKVRRPAIEQQLATSDGEWVNRLLFASAGRTGRWGGRGWCGGRGMQPDRQPPRNGRHHIIISFGINVATTVSSPVNREPPLAAEKVGKRRSNGRR